MKPYQRLLLLLTLLLSSTSAFATKGVAFIHGTGQQTDALNDYWTSDFVNSVKQNNGKYIVINCDFDQYMWHTDAAQCLANQLTTFIRGEGIRKLTLVTHSNGANVVRWIFSNPTAHRKFPRIIKRTQKIIALAPSSAGTPLADAVMQGNSFETALGWLLGYQSDAVKQQQVAEMAYYNSTLLHGTDGRPSLAKPLYSVVGSDVESAIWDSDSYCGGYTNQVALEFTQNWLDDCSDGFLECSSQAAAGSVWFIDKDKTAGSEPLSHQQSRRACFNLDTFIRDFI